MLFKYAPRNHSVHSATERRLNIVLRHTAKHDTTALKNSIIFFQWIKGKGIKYMNSFKVMLR